MSRPSPDLARALTFEPRLEERVWGGRALERYGKILLPGLRVGESWEISDVEGMASRVSRGPCRGSPLREIVRSFPEAILGPARKGPDSFPLLFKLIDAREDLSVQVHPSDEDLRRAGLTAHGKTEAWVILEAEPGAGIIHGLAAGVEREAFFSLMEGLRGEPLGREREEALFRWVSVNRGDVIFVPAGTIHAIGKGILLLEVQQTSDITYRIYDWGRRGDGGKPRSLHIREARAVGEPARVPCPIARIEDSPGERGIAPLMACEKFRVELLSLGAGREGEASSTAEGPAPGFHVLAGYRGEVRYEAPGDEPLEIRAGSFVLLPAALGPYALHAEGGDAAVLRFRE